jgi:hypothetical protein
MKTTLFLSTIAAGLVALSTTTFAQNAGAAYAQAYGDAYAGVTPSLRYLSPMDRFTGSDLGNRRRVTGRHHTTE